MSSTLGKLATYPPAFSSSATKVTRFGNYYVVQTPTAAIPIGVIGNELVIGFKTSPAQLNAFATAPATPATGAQGSVAFRIGLPALLSGLLHTAASSQIAQSILGHLGDITGSTSASTSGLTGSATLGLH